MGNFEKVEFLNFSQKKLDVLEKKYFKEISYGEYLKMTEEFF